MRTLFILYSLVTLVFISAGCKSSRAYIIEDISENLNPVLQNTRSPFTQISTEARVEYVNTKEAYIVFKDNHNPSTGVYGKCIRKGRITAYIIVEPIRSGSHIIARIEQGLPRVGDRILAAE